MYRQVILSEPVVECRYKTFTHKHAPAWYTKMAAVTYPVTQNSISYTMPRVILFIVVSHQKKQRQLLIYLLNKRVIFFYVFTDFHLSITKWLQRATDLANTS